MSGVAPALTIRPARPEDLGPVMAIERRAFADPWPPEALFSELHSDYLRLPLVAEIQGLLVGYLMAWLVADQLHILNIATHPDHLRRGVATALFLAAMTEARNREMAEVTLEVRRSNTGAIAFYRRHGFHEAGIRPGYYQDNGEDAIIMTADIPATGPTRGSTSP
jgi:ribosomal-protein-alanine N-acetyltransferase